MLKFCLIFSMCGLSSLPKGNHQSVHQNCRRIWVLFPRFFFLAVSLIATHIISRVAYHEASLLNEVQKTIKSRMTRPP